MTITLPVQNLFFVPQPPSQLAPWVNAGWEVQSVQPPHRGNEHKVGGIMPDDDGTEGPFVNWKNIGFEQVKADIVWPQGRQNGIYRAGGTMRGDDGIQATFINWRNSGFEQVHALTVWPPGRQSGTYRVGGVLRGDDGTQGTFVNWINGGWEVQPVQPPHAPRHFRFGAIAPKDDGTEAVYVFVPVSQPTWGFEFYFQPGHPRRERSGAIMRGSDGTENPFIAWQNVGSEVQSVQPPHPRPERSGAIAVGDAGTQAIYVNWLNVGYEVQPPQPPHPRPERSGSVMVGDGGIQAAFVPPPAFVSTFLFDHHPMLRQPALSRVQAISGQSEFLASSALPWWETPAFQPGHPRPERAAGIIPGDDGIEAPFIFVPLVQVSWGFETPLQYPRKAWKSLAVGDDGIELPLVQWFNYGWMVQDPQPPHPRPERSGAFMRGDEGTEAVYVFVPLTPLTPWPEQPQFQPPHPRPEKSGAVARGDDGIQARFTYWFNAGWQFDTFVVPHPRPERSGALAKGDDGAAAGLVGWFNFGWLVQDPQPPHPRPERSAAVLRGIDGTEAPFIFVPPGFVTWSETPLMLPPHRRIEARGAVLRGDDGTQGIFTTWQNAGWEIQAWQPPHPRREKAGSIMVGEQGTEAVFVFVPYIFIIAAPTLLGIDDNAKLLGEDGLGLLFGKVG